MAGKLPAFQYYPKDWQADAVFGCSLAARGLWHEMMNVMHGCEPYGHLVENGGPMADERIARKCGATLEEYAALLAELDAAGVPRRTRAGIIFSKRMVEDQQKRDGWRERQQKHRGKGGSSHAPVTGDKLDAGGVPRQTRAEIISQNSVVEDQEKRDEWRKGQQKHGDAGGSSHAHVTPMSRPSSSSSPKHKKLAENRSLLCPPSADEANAGAPQCSPSPEVTPAGMDLACLLRQMILENNPKAIIKENQVVAWGREADLMLRLDRRTPEEISALIQWSQRDNFWKSNILSMGKLRDRFDQLTMKKAEERGNNANGNRKNHGINSGRNTDYNARRVVLPEL